MSAIGLCTKSGLGSQALIMHITKHFSFKKDTSRHINCFICTFLWVYLMVWSCWEEHTNHCWHGTFRQCKHTSWISRCCFSTSVLHLGHGILAWFSSKWMSISAFGIGSLQCLQREMFLLQCISCSTKFDELICLRLKHFQIARFINLNGQWYEHVFIVLYKPGLWYAKHLSSCLFCFVSACLQVTRMLTGNQCLTLTFTY
jgi:hypothetical protein